MNKRLTKVLAVFLMLSLLTPTVACSQVEDIFGLHHESRSSRRDRHRDRDDDDDDEDEDEDEEEEEEETSETTEETSETTLDVTTFDTEPGDTTYDIADLTYPDHVPTYDELHPAHMAGTISGDEASDILDMVEHDVLQWAIDNYVDCEILFEDPSVFGITCDTVSWGEMDMDVEDDAAFINEQLELLYSIDPDSLDYQDRAFYDKIVYDLEIDAYMVQYSAFNFYETSLDPLLGPQCDLFFILDVLEFDSVEDAQNYILLLEDLDRYFDEHCDFEEERAARGFASTDAVYADIAASFDGLAAQEDDCFLYESFEARLDNIDGLTEDVRTELIDAHNAVMHDTVFPEFQECSDRMNALIGSGGVQQGVSAYPGGDAYYAVRFATFSNSSVGIDERTVQLDNMLTGLMDSVNAVAYSGDFSWYDEYTNPPCSLGDVTENLDYLYEQIAPDFPDLPEHEYRLRDVPEALEENFSPAAYLGYHLDSFDSNLIITNRSGVDETFGITCSHEGYPGHMFQSVYTRSVCEHPYLYIADSVGYVEGWATYVENYCFKYFVTNETAMVLLQADNELNVLLFARLDIGINWEGWSLSDCTAYLSDLLGQSLNDSAVEQMYNIVTNQPGYGVKYGIGFLNTGLTIQSVREQFPDATDEEIFTAYLNALPLTFEMIEERMVTALS